MYPRNTEIFKNPIQLLRPLTVDPKKRLERRISVDPNNRHRPQTSGGQTHSKKHDGDFQSNSTSTLFSFASDDDYDTDLEDDLAPQRDHSCLGTYKRACEREQTVPAGQYLRHYNDEELSMQFYGLGPRGMRALIPSLTMNQVVTKLDLSSNGLSDEGIIYLSYILRDNIAIVEIDLSRNFIGIDGARALCDMFRDNITLNHLKLDGNLFNDECARLFAELISSTGQLHTLSLAKNRLGTNAGNFLGPALAENTTMHSLDLSGNFIKDKGAVNLIKGIQKNVFLKILNLANNGLSGVDCGRAWLNAFKENGTLLELDLSYNRLTVEPATYIGRGLAKNENLQVLRLTGNPLESAGCYALLKPLMGKTSIVNNLKLIDITEIIVNRDFQDLYVQLGSQRPDLRVLIGVRAAPLLLHGDRRSPPSPMERLRTLFHRRPELDLAQFFMSIATGSNDPASQRIISHSKLQTAIREKLNAQFTDADIEKLLADISQFDYKTFVQTFDNKVSTTNLMSSAVSRIKT